ncbi:hypothetical protein ElyMa_001849100 [Elysia marginata]|uniref:Uncharacterized protein n=1 Tax=Elysia marginata TaxID=1093978 RepID=A0AAV4EL16_9GAST|nr:hypothetical protein ElyMa_001849100 [Elysia marginata]
MNPVTSRSHTNVSHDVKEALDIMRRQIAEHRKNEAKMNTQSAQERRELILSETDSMNATFPWLTASFVNDLVGGEYDSVMPPGILQALYLYKFMEQLSTGRGFRTYLGVMRRNDLWCNIRTYGFAETKNSSYLAHKLSL